MKYNVFLMSLIMAISSAVIAAPVDIATLIEGKAKESGNTHLNRQRRYIITGGPCVGKTHIINSLKNDFDHAIVREAATDIKIELDDLGIERPWEDPDLDLKISNRIHMRQVESLLSQKDLIFYDRGPVDPLAYACYNNFPAHFTILQRVEEILQTSFYETTIFLIAPLAEEFYANNIARHEDRKTSEELGEHLALCYEALGFKVERVPFLPIKERAQWILDHIDSIS